MGQRTQKNEFIANARAQTGLVQKEFALLIRTTAKTLSLYETGVRQPSERVLALVRQVLIDRGLSDGPCTPAENRLLEEFRLLPPSDQDRFSGILHSLTQAYGKRPRRKSAQS